ncbi:MAG: hypothetical protein JRJ24_15890 [Deltaproteobacteria bacterium]|nr:hypothetical protein [Deltaproteobacteria bacterium]
MRFWIILSVLSALVLASCSKKEPEPAPAEAAEAAEAEAAEIQAPAEEAEAEPADVEPLANPWDSWGEPGLTVLASGKAPLRKLRRTFKKGRKATVELQVKGDADVKAMSLSYELSLQTVKVSKDGATASVALRVEKPAAFKGVRGQYTADALGGITDFEIQPPSNPDPQVQAAIRNLARFLLPVLVAPLPEGEVGEGAQWSVFEAIEDGPITIATRSIYELTKLDGSKLAVSLTFEEAVQKSAPGGPMKLLELNGAGSGTLSVDLGKIAPDRVQRDASRTQKYAQGDGGQVFRMAIKTTTLLSSR